MKREEFAEDVYRNCCEGIAISHDEFIEAFLADYDSTLSLPPAEGAEEILDSLYDFMKPFFTEVGDYCRRGHTLNGRKMDVNQIYGILGRIKKAIADREHAQRLADKIVSERLREAVHKAIEEEKTDIRKWLLDEGYELLSEKV